MRFDAVLNSFYVVGSLWNAPTDPRICPSRLHTPPRAVHDITSARVPGTLAEVTAFVDVQVVPMDTERVLTNQTVLVEGGRITALGPSNKVQVPAGAVRIDGRGKYLMPGLGDMHVHDHNRDISARTYDEVVSRLSSYVAEGVTTIRYINPAVGERPELFKKAEVLGPYIYTPGFVVTDRGEVKSYQDWHKKLDQPDSMRTYVAAAKAAGYDFIRLDASAVHARRTLPLVDSLLAAAHRLGMPVAAHSHERSLGHVLALGAFGGSDEHLATFNDTLGLWNPKPRIPWEYWADSLGQHEAAMLRSELPALAAAAQRTGVWITPTLACIEKKYTISPNRLIVLRQLVKALQDAGAGLLLGGDENGTVQDELSTLVRAGLTPYQALATGTLNVARYFGIFDSSGTIAIGKRADLVLLYGNPLQDIRHAREPAGVMLHGHWLDRAALDRRLLAGGLSPIYHTLAQVGTAGWPHPLPLAPGRARAAQGAHRAVHGAERFAGDGTSVGQRGGEYGPAPAATAGRETRSDTRDPAARVIRNLRSTRACVAA